MKPQLTLEHIAPYLPYGLKVLRPDEKTILEVEGLSNNFYYFKEKGMSLGDIHAKGNKPMLRNLSDLTKPITVEGYNDGKEFVSLQVLRENFKNIYFEIGNNHKLQLKGKNETFISVEDFDAVNRQLRKWHFAINISEDLYVDINTLKL